MKLTERQRLVLRAVAAGNIPPIEVVSRRLREMFDRPSATPTWTRDYNAIGAVGKQLASKGLVIEHGVPYGPKRWSVTPEGAAADLEARS